MNPMLARNGRCSARFLKRALMLSVLFLATARGQTPSPALLVLEKADNMLALVDPASLKVVGRVPAGPDPHEIEASPDGKFAYISNYGGLDSSLNTITVVDVVAQKPLAPINLGALHSPHGLFLAGDKLYFTVETNKAAGRYDLATQAIDWVMGTGQDRTHMVVASSAGDRVFTSNVSSGTISIIEQVALQAPAGPPPGAPPAGAPALSSVGGLRKTWRITNIPAGRGSEGFDLSPDGKEIWAANAGDGTVTIIDVAAKKAVKTFPIAVRGNRLKFTRDGKRVLVAGTPTSSSSAAAGATLVILDTATHNEVKHFDLGGFSNGILMPDNSRAFVAVSAKDKAVVLNLQTLELTGSIATGKGPDGLAWAHPK